jgi:hypothetical protein
MAWLVCGPHLLAEQLGPIRESAGLAIYDEAGAARTRTVVPAAQRNHATLRSQGEPLVKGVVPLQRALFVGECGDVPLERRARHGNATMVQFNDDCRSLKEHGMYARLARLLERRARVRPTSNHWPNTSNNSAWSGWIPTPRCNSRACLLLAGPASA